MNRTLRSKRLRALLWYEADGKCQLCGQPLGDDWHADHIDPFSKTGRTNVHEMQALCARCNLRKGDRMKRKHQREFETTCKEIAASARNVRDVLVGVTPGGGKSALPPIAAQTLIPDLADAICWVVPRETLQRQAERNFIEPMLRMLTGCRDHRIRISTNDTDPCRGLSGFVTTYQAIAAAPDLHRREFERKRYILFLDEPHHVEEDGVWARALAPLVERAVLRVYASGTLERGDGKKIAFLPYEMVGNGWTLDYQRDGWAYIRYSRVDALTEDAIVPLHFQMVNGRAQWTDQDGNAMSAASLADAGKDTSAALLTVLQTQYAYQMLEDCVNNWRAHKAIFPAAKLLIVAPNIKTAKDYYKHLVEEWNIHAVIATSDDSAAAKAALTRFRGEKDVKAVDVCVTVGMAYEGLDVPPITHVAVLTHIRSRPWLEQCFARANRKHGPKTYGHIYGPDDIYFRAVMEAIKAEQEPFVREPKEGPKPPPPPPPTPDKGIIPEASEATQQRAADLMGEEVNYAETQAILEVMEKHNLRGISVINFKHAVDDLKATPNGNGAPPAPPDLTAPLLTPSEEESRLRAAIEGHIRKYAYHSGTSPKAINEEIYDHFKKPRADMRIDELRRAWAFVQSRYPLELLREV